MEAGQAAAELSNLNLLAADHTGLLCFGLQREDWHLCQESGDIRILRLPRQEVRDQLRPRRRDDGDARDATRDELRQDLLHVASAQVALGLQELRDITSMCRSRW